MVEKRVILEASLLALGFELQAAIKDGWEIDPEMPLTQVWTQYECGLVRDVEEAQESDVELPELDVVPEADSTVAEAPEIVFTETLPDVANADAEIPTSLLKEVPEVDAEVEPVAPKRQGRPPKQK